MNTKLVSFDVKITDSINEHNVTQIASSTFFNLLNGMKSEFDESKLETQGFIELFKFMLLSVDDDWDVFVPSHPLTKAVLIYFNLMNYVMPAQHYFTFELGECVKIKIYFKV